MRLGLAQLKFFFSALTSDGLHSRPHWHLSFMREIVPTSVHANQNQISQKY